MGSVTGIRGTGAGDSEAEPRADQPSAAAARSSRALIALRPIRPDDSEMRARPQAEFLAHLIATDRKLPQTRQRRRAQPEDAVAAYAATGAERPARAGRRLSRTT